MTIFNAFIYPTGAVVNENGGTEFNFYVKNIKTTKDAENVLRHHCVLVNELKGDCCGRRTGEFVNTNSAKIQNYILFEIEPKTPESIIKICNYFKYKKHIIISDDKTLKGILFTSIYPFQVKNVYRHLYGDLEEHGKLNLELSKPFSCLGKCAGKVISENNDGSIFKYKYRRQVFPKFDIKSKDLENICREYFSHLGFTKDYNENCYYKGNLHFDQIETSPWVMACRESNIFDVNIKEALKYYVNSQTPLRGNIKRVNSQMLVNPDFEAEVSNVVNNGGILAIKSYMGSGKSNAIEFAISEAQKIKKKILIITPRQSLSKDFKERFEIQHYLDDKINPKKSVICQYDSLYKLNIKNYDVVIIDEFVSVLFHAITNLSQRKRLLLELFYWALKKPLIVCDAFLDSDSLSILPENPTIIVNDYKDTIPIEELSEDAFINKIKELLSQNEKIAISTNSVKYIDAKLSEFCELYGKTRLVVTGKSTINTKGFHVQELKNRDFDNDIIIYSPVVNVGVNIYKKIKHHFHFDSGLSADVIASIQMMRRARKAQSIYYCIKERQNNFIEDVIKMKDYLLKNLSKNESWAVSVIDGENGFDEVGNLYVKILCLKNKLLNNNILKFKSYLNDNFIIKEQK